MTALLYILPIAGLSALLLRGVRWWGALGYAVLMVFGLCAAVETLGLPRPIWTEPRPKEDLQVIAQYAEANVAVYVWVMTERGPVVYALPWREETAKAAQDAEKQGLPYVMDYDPMEPVFHPTPVPTDPPKQ